MFGCKVSGGKLEVLVECMFDEYMILVYVCLLKLFKLGIEFYLGENDEFYVVMQVCYDVLFEICFIVEIVVLDIFN